eukprot:CAMPEP_0172162532 /NCGR_PEP_ID=MMETSP1050-20130122/6727_1 /TAXON_ID=233186 /ORGANISM="Cryptomonas curvata, Strain CCAP979/52" /LENGTH=343 /DNA_ID=CAMNT_0012832539 /DNA_START=105 /DNA_END=1132 /DNA_ORIENTATION=-
MMHFALDFLLASTMPSGSETAGRGRRTLSCPAGSFGDGGMNLARDCGGGACSTAMSSTLVYHDAPLANDGNTAGDFAHTLEDPAPWWRVDLGSARRVGAARLWARTDCCQERLDGFEAWVGDDGAAPNATGNALCHRDAAVGRQHNATPYSSGFACAGRGRYFFVALPQFGVVTLVEVEVYDACDPCPIGAFSAAGSSACAPCPPNTFSNATGATSCQRCPSGSEVGPPGSASCAPKTPPSRVGHGPCELPLLRWQNISALEGVGAWTGGLGRLATADVQAWACVEDESLPLACGGSADAGNATGVGGGGGGGGPPELACFVYLEGARRFAFWGRNSALLLVR